MNDERKFLHDVAGPIATALFVADSLLEDLKEAGPVQAELASQLAQVTQALEKTQVLLQNRRKVLLERGEGG